MMAPLLAVQPAGSDLPAGPSITSGLPADFNGDDDDTLITRYYDLAIDAMPASGWAQFVLTNALGVVIASYDPFSGTPGDPAGLDLLIVTPPENPGDGIDPDAGVRMYAIGVVSDEDHTPTTRPGPWIAVTLPTGPIVTADITYDPDPPHEAIAWGFTVTPIVISGVTNTKVRLFENGVFLSDFTVDNATPSGDFTSSISGGNTYTMRAAASGDAASSLIYSRFGTPATFNT